MVHQSNMEMLLLLPCHKLNICYEFIVIMLTKFKHLSFVQDQSRKLRKKIVTSNVIGNT